MAAHQHFGATTMKIIFDEYFGSNGWDSPEKRFHSLLDALYNMFKVYGCHVVDIEIPGAVASVSIDVTYSKYGFDNLKLVLKVLRNYWFLGRQLKDCTISKSGSINFKGISPYTRFESFVDFIRTKIEEIAEEDSIDISNFIIPDSNLQSGRVLFEVNNNNCPSHAFVALAKLEDFKKIFRSTIFEVENNNTIKAGTDVNKQLVLSAKPLRYIVIKRMLFGCDMIATKDFGWAADITHLKNVYGHLVINKTVQENVPPFLDDSKEDFGVFPNYNNNNGNNYGAFNNNNNNNNDNFGGFNNNNNNGSNYGPSNYNNNGSNFGGCNNNNNNNNNDNNNNFGGFYNNNNNNGTNYGPSNYNNNTNDNFSGFDNNYNKNTNIASKKKIREPATLHGQKKNSELEMSQCLCVYNQKLSHHPNFFILIFLYLKDINDDMKTNSTVRQ